MLITYLPVTLTTSIRWDSKTIRLHLGDMEICLYFNLIINDIVIQVTFLLADVIHDIRLHLLLFYATNAVDSAKMAKGGSYMSMPVSNSLGMQMCMTSDYSNGTTNYNNPPLPWASQCAPQHGNLMRSRPKSGTYFMAIRNGIP